MLHKDVISLFHTIPISPQRNNRWGFFVSHSVIKLKQMTKKQIKQLVTDANKAIANVAHAIITLTAGNPLILFDKDNADAEADDIYDLPIGYTVNKYEDYLQGAVWKVEGDDVTLFLTGESWGQLYSQNVNDLPFESQTEILDLIAERTEV